MTRQPLLVGLTRLLARVIARGYPRSLRARTGEIRAFNEEAIDRAWTDRGAAGLVALVARLVKDVAAARWRGGALPITRDGAPGGRTGLAPRGRALPDLVQDLRHEVRALARKPGFTVAAAVTLAVGIGANTAIFTIVNGVLLRPLPFPDSGAVVRVVTHWNDFGQGSISEPEFLDLLDRSSSFATMGLFRNTSVNLTDGAGDPEQVSAANVTPSLFRVLGVRAAAGRAFENGAGRAGADRVVMLSDAIWRSRFGADPDVVGRTITLRGASYRVVGIVPPGFDFPSRQTRLWLAWQPDPAKPGNRGNHSSIIVARLAAGVPVARAQAELDRIAADLRREHADNYPADSDFHFVVQPYLEVVTGAVRPALLILLAAASLVLLIACVNVANLFLARIAERQRQIALRAALGAGTGRLVRQLVTGSLLLSALGGAGGIVLAAAAVRLLVAIPAGTLPRAQDVRVDGTVFLFNALLVVATGLLVGLLPARRSVRVDLASTLKEGGRAVGGPARRRTRSALVVAEVALATVLLVGAGLLLRSFSRTMAVDPGFRSDGVVTARLTLDPARYAQGPARIQFFDRLFARLQTQPDITAAGAITILPLSNDASDQWVAPTGHAFDGDARNFIQFRLVTPGYFDAMRIPVLRGRNFSRDDTPGAPPVVIVSASLARQFWGSGDPIGRRIATNPDNQYTVVGVVGDVHDHGLAGGDTPIWYRAYSQFPDWSGLTIVAREASRADPAAIGAAVHAVDPLQPVYDVKPMSAWASDSVSSERLNSWLLGLLAALAVLLSGIGLYAVISYGVSLRTQEIGIRMALGADRWRVRRLVVGHGLVLTGAGVALGLVLALWLTRVLATRLYGVTTTDVPTYLGAAALLAVVALAADLAPALRATRVDPIVALRHE
jgi:putative ABC transport system permease protein